MGSKTRRRRRGGEQRRCLSRRRVDVSRSWHDAEAYSAQESQVRRGGHNSASATAAVHRSRRITTAATNGDEQLEQVGGEKHEQVAAGLQREQECERIIDNRCFCCREYRRRRNQRRDECGGDRRQVEDQSDGVDRWQRRRWQQEQTDCVRQKGPLVLVVVVVVVVVRVALAARQRRSPSRLTQLVLSQDTWHSGTASAIRHDQVNYHRGSNSNSSSSGHGRHGPFGLPRVHVVVVQGGGERRRVREQRTVNFQRHFQGAGKAHGQRAHEQV